MDLGINLALTAIRKGGGGLVFSPVDVSDQDATIEIGERLYDFSTADTDWTLQNASRFANLLRFDVREGFRAPYDETNDRPYLRSEINGLDTFSGEFWIAFDVMLPEVDGLLDETTTMLCQVKAKATETLEDPGAPIFRIDALSDGLYVRTSGTATDPTPVPFTETITRLQDFPMVANTWDRFVVRLLPDPTNGELDVYRNGRLALSVTGIAMGYVDYDYYVKFGIYSREEIGSLVSYHANMLVGTDLEYLVETPEPLPALGIGVGQGYPAPETNLTPDGDFNDDQLGEWEQQSGTVTATGGRIRVARGGGSIGRARRALVGLQVGQTYTLSVDRFLGNRTLTRVLVAIEPTNATGAIVDDQRADVGTWTVDFVPTQTTHYIFLQTPSGVDGDYVEFDNVSVKLQA